MLEQAFLQMSEVAVGVSGRSHPFVDLCQVDLMPRDFLSGQITKHNPRGVPATDREDEAPALGDCRSSVCGDQSGGLASDGIGICKYFNLHKNVSHSGFGVMSDELLTYQAVWQ
jgi:hypothetical protein